MAKRDYYDMLGVGRDATEKEITSAYRKLAIKYHPDSHPDDQDATAKFKQAAEAYDILNDPDKRARYDQYGEAGLGGGGGFHSVDDIFDAFGDIFSGGRFGDLFGGGRGRRSRAGADVRADVELTLDEAAKGVTKKVSFRRRELCKKCDGSGAKPGADKEFCPICAGRGQVVQAAGILRVQTTCPECRGAGYKISEYCGDCRGEGVIARKITLPIPIPAGVDDGTRVRVKGEGEPSPDGGPPGACYCFVHLAAHPLFQREGPNLILQLPVSYCQAALGATLEVPTLNGADELVIPRGTQSGDVFRLRGRGITDVHSGVRGDLLVNTFIETPKKVNAEQDRLLRELAELEQVDVTPRRKSFLKKLRGYVKSLHDEASDGSSNEREHA
jgi:molecular chaperone DnaJ